MKKKDFDIAVIGGDLRQIYMAEELSRRGYRVCVFSSRVLYPEKETAYVYMDSAEECIVKAPVLAGGIPLMKAGDNMNGTDRKAVELAGLLEEGQHFFAGCIPEEIREIIKRQGAFAHDWMEKKSLALYNSIAAAEGILAEAITLSPGNLNKSRCLVLGYGICGKTLVSYLTRMFCEVTVFARDPIQRSEAEIIAAHTVSPAELPGCLAGFDFIFNTVPALILGEKELKFVSEETLIFDLASRPGGIQWEAAEKLGIQAKSCSGLPGKYAPEASAKELVRQMLEDLKKVQ